MSYLHDIFQSGETITIGHRHESQTESGLVIPRLMGATQIILNELKRESSSLIIPEFERDNSSISIESLRFETPAESLVYEDLSDYVALGAKGIQEYIARQNRYPVGVGNAAILEDPYTGAKNLSTDEISAIDSIGNTLVRSIADQKYNLMHPDDSSSLSIGNYL